MSTSGESTERNDYRNHFDTEFYLDGMFSNVNSDSIDEQQFVTFFIENTVRVLKEEGKHLGNKKALEYGGRPSLWESFILAQYVDSIRFCDYIQSNLDAVQDWIEKENNAFDWTKTFEWILDVGGVSKGKLSQ